jgi:hypothetical protein
MTAFEIIAEFDPVLEKHISEYGNPGEDKTSYFIFFNL